MIAFFLGLKKYSPKEGISSTIGCNESKEIISSQELSGTDAKGIFEIATIAMVPMSPFG